MNYKTLIPSLVGVGIMTYETVSGHMVGSEVQEQILNYTLTLVGLGVTIFGVIKNHKKG